MNKRAQIELPKDAVRQYHKAIVCAVCHKPAVANKRGGRAFAVGVFHQPGKDGKDCIIWEFLCTKHAQQIDPAWPKKLALRTTHRFNPHSKANLREQLNAGQSSYLLDPLNERKRTDWQAELDLPDQPPKLWQPAGLMLPPRVPIANKPSVFARRRACYERQGGHPQETYAELIRSKMILYGQGVIALPAAAAPDPTTESTPNLQVGGAYPHQKESSMLQTAESRQPITFWYCAGAIAPIRTIRYLTPSNAVSVWSQDRIVQFANVRQAGKVYLVRRVMSDCGRWGEWETYLPYPPYHLI